MKISTISTSIWPGYSSSKASRRAFALARCPPPVSDIRICIVPVSFANNAVVVGWKAAEGDFNKEFVTIGELFCTENAFDWFAKSNRGAIVAKLGTLIVALT